MSRTEVNHSLRLLLPSASAAAVVCGLLLFASPAARAQQAGDPPAPKPAAKKRAAAAAKKSTPPATQEAAAPPATQEAVPAATQETTAGQKTSPAKKRAAARSAAKRQQPAAPDSGATTATAADAKSPADAKPADAKPAVEKSPADAKSSADKSEAGDKPADAAAQGEPGKAAKVPQTGKPGAVASDAAVALKLTDEAAKARLAEIQKLAAWERIADLEDLLDAEMSDAAELRAIEQLVSALAAHGDERLQKGDTARGVELFRQAVREAPADMTDRLFFEVVSQFPANLYLRGQRAAAFDLAARIERRAKDNAGRLAALAPFYLSVERADEAARLAAASIKLAPDLAAAHQALAAAHRQLLRLDEAAASYARALELDPKSTGARRSLADLRRGAGRTDEALALYRELLAADPKDAGARGGVVLSLFDGGKREEAERELEAALKDDPKNFPLLAGAAYWYAARGDGAARALDLATRAVGVEPRYPWAQIALARALVAANRPLEAERTLRFARLHARFPTLDYELASALAAAGLFDEAAEILAQSFTLKGGRVETKLAGRVAAGGGDFVELLAPERRASFFQPNAAETSANARRMKALFTLHQSSRAGAPGAKSEADESSAVAAAGEFALGDDEMRAFRELYAADRLVRRGVAHKTAFELTEAARKGLDAALASPHAPVAALAEELRELRERAIERGGTPSVPALPANMLSNLVRGRVEDLAGRALFNQGRSEEAAAAHRRAVALLPETGRQWRAAQWHLGVALAGTGDQASALAAYIKSYDARAPDPARLALIESLYRKINGSIAGLGRALSAPAAAPAASFERASGTTATATAAAAAQPPDPAATTTPAQTESTAAATTDAKKSGEAETPRSEAETKKAAAEGVTPAVTPTPEPSPAVTPSPAATPSPTAEPSSSPATPAATPDPASSATDEKSSSASPGKGRRAGGSSSPCALAVETESLSLVGGASGSIVIRLEGDGDLARATATTPNWSDIIVLREPTAAAEPDTARFTVTSISKTAGTYVVTVKSPCGAKDVAVSVK